MLKRINTILLVALILCLSMPLTMKAQGEQKVSIALKNVPLIEFLNAVEKQTDYTFMYTNISLDKKVTVDVQNKDLKDVLDSTMKKMGINFEFSNNRIILRDGSQEKSKGPEIKVNGTVTDETGAPLTGVSVAVENETVGTITDLDGNYTLNANSNSTLVFSFIGFHNYKVKVEGKNTINVVLKEDTQLLDEVIVVGYGTLKKRDVTTSIARVSSKDLEGQPVTSLVEAMAGKMPGVQISQGSGAPGEALDIKVRGTGTITAGTSPLYVVDGIPLAKDQMNSFNMNDVESIEVLKDASSAAIYGSRGSNGVVMITTKQGSEGKPVIRYNGYYGWQTVSKKIDMLNAYEYADLVKDARNNTYSDAMESINRKRLASGQTALNYSLSDNNAQRLLNTGTNYNTIIPVEITPYLNGEQGLTDTNWQDEIFRTAGIQNHNISVGGGSGKAKYYMSLDYLGQDGVIINSDFQRYSGRINLDVTEGIFKFGINFNPSYIKENIVKADGAYNSDGGGVISSALHSAPIFSVYNPDGSFNFAQNAWSPNTMTEMPDGSQKWGNSQTQVWNPVALAMLNKDYRRTTRIFGNTYVLVNILPELSYKANLGFDLFNQKRDRFRPSTLPVSNTKGNPESDAESKVNTALSYSWVFEQTANYKKDFGLHSLDAVAGWTMQSYKQESTYAFANGFITNNITTQNAGVVTRGDSKASRWSLLSALARVQYSYDSKYMLSGAIRADGASRFGQDNKWGYFPSVSAGWRITQEPFMAGTRKFLDDLKLRLSYGLTGNFNIPNYGSYGELGYVGYVLGSTSPGVVTGVSPKEMPNSKLKWEKTSQVNVGFDATLFNNKLNLVLDMYNSNTYDLLLDVPVPMTTGYKTRLENIGKVNNKGVEFTVSTEQNTGKVNWGGYFNISKNINEVKELGPGNADIIASGSVSNAYFITRVGESIGSYYLPVVEGVFKDQAEVDASLHYVDSPSNYGLNDSKPGDFKFKDVNGDGVLDILDTDRAIVGNYMPDFTYGFGGNLSWNGFDFSFAFQGVYGNEILNLSRRYFYNHEGNMNNYKGALNRWRSESDPGSGMNVRANRVSKGQNGTTSTWHVEDGSYLRLKNITLGYTLPKKWTNKAYIETARVYISGQNVFTITDYEGYNPEVSNRRSEATRAGEDYGVYPLARTISVGVNLTF